MLRSIVWTNRIIMGKLTGKLGPLDSSQKKITNFFKTNFVKKAAGSNDEEGGKKGSEAESKSKRRKTSKFLKPSNNRQNAVEVIDLENSDGEDFICVIAEGGEGKGSENQARSFHATKMPVDVKPFNPNAICETNGNIVPVDCEIRNLDETLTDDDGGQETQKCAEVVINGQDESDEVMDANLSVASEDGLIRLTNFKNILEDSQSSCASASSVTVLTDDDNMECTQRMEVSYVEAAFAIPKPRSPVKLEFASSTTVFNSPSKRSASSSSSSSPSSTRKLPLKSPKSTINRFSPIKLLNLSKSKTPNKSPRVLFQSSPSRNLAMKSPLKALWTPRSDPYYLKNFMTVLTTVLDDKYNSHLLNAEDHETVSKFHSLSKPAKCLLVRLANRTWKWLRATSVNYNEIGEDLEPVFKELYDQHFVSEIKEEELPLQEILDMLPHDKLPSICKQLNVKVPLNLKTKEKCIEALLNTVKKQSTLHGSIEDIIKSKARKEIGTAYKLKKQPRDLFQRMFILFSPPQYWEQEADKDKLQLLSILLSELGKMEYPTYKIHKTQSLYKDRTDLLEFQEAWTLFGQIEAYTESKQWEEVIDVAKEARESLRRVLSNSELVETHKNLPIYLRAYVAGSLFTKICWLGVEGYQKLRHYEDANEFLRFLLDQSVYLSHYHGPWYERLILNSTHLKISPSEVTRMIEGALESPNVRDNHKLDLYSRLTKLKSREAKKKKKPKRKPKKKRKKAKKKGDDDEFCQSSSESEDSSESEEEAVVDVELEDRVGSYHIRHPLPEKEIEGEKMPMFDREHGKSVFMDKGGNALSSVERFVMQYYRQDGYNNGIHAEGAVPSTIYGLIFWDIIYDDEISDVFLSPYQAFPLDMLFEDFRLRRSSQINQRLDNLKSHWNVERTLELMLKHWTENLNKVSVVNWEVFESFEQLQTLVASIGLPVIAGICDRLANNYRYYRSGFPDLIIWNETKYRFIEVKGPGDKLSAKQRLWIDYLLSLHADVEVCHVKSTSNKRLRTSKRT